MTHVFPYINTITGFMVWSILILNAVGLLTLVYRVVRHSEKDAFVTALFMEGAIAFNVAVCAFTLFHPSLLDFASTGSFWALFFSFLTWYAVMHWILWINLGLTFDLLFYVAIL